MKSVRRRRCASNSKYLSKRQEASFYAYKYKCPQIEWVLNSCIQNDPTLKEKFIDLNVRTPNLLAVRLKGSHSYMYLDIRNFRGDYMHWFDMEIERNKQER